MATKKFSAFTAGSTNQVPTDVLVGLDLSLAANAQNTKWTLNNLFAVVTRNITDGALRFGGFAAPAVSGAGEGSIYFDSTSNTFKISQNAGAYANIGNVTTTGFTTTRVPIASGANTLTDDAGLTFNTTTNILSVGEATGGGVGLVGSNGNSNVLASQAPAATLLTYWPNAAPTAGQFLYAFSVGAQVQLGYQTAPSGSGSNTQIAVWGASNALAGSSALTFASGVVSITGTTNPGVVITGSAATESGITVNQSVSGAAADAFHSFQTPSSTVVWRLTTAGFTPTGLVKANQLDMLGAAGTVEMLFRLADASTRFVYGVNNVEAASINATSTLGLVLGAASTLTGRVRMFNSVGTTYSQISAGNAASSLNFIWPVVNPTSGQVLSASAPSGSDVTLSWATPAAGATLTATQVGFGSGANVLTGSVDFTYVDATGVLDLTKTGLNSSVRITAANASAGTAAQARFGASANVSGASLAAYSSTFVTSGLITANTALLDLDGPNALVKGQTGQTLTFALGNTARATLTDSAMTVITTGASAFAVGANGATNPAFLVNTNTASVATGVSVTGAAAGNGVALTVLSSGSNESLLVVPKGAGAVEQRNSTQTQLYHLYSTFTDSSNYRRISSYGTFSSGQPGIWANGLGTGANADLFLAADRDIKFYTAATMLTVTSDGRLFGSALHNNAGAVTGTTNQYIASGTYTPTVTAVANCTATSSGPCNWIRVGNVVTVSGIVAIDPTVAATFTSVGISLPIASNLATNASTCAGAAANANVLGYCGAISADITNDRASLDFTAGADVANQGWSFTFAYVVL